MSLRKLGLNLLISAILVTAFWPIGSIHAQEQSLRLAAVDVSILPEFNRPSVLVVYEIMLPEDISLPIELIIQVPDDAQVLAVSNRAQDNSLSALENEVIPIGEWKDIQFTSRTRSIRIEYYDPNLVRNGNLREFRFNWLSIYPVDSLSLIVRQPFGAGDISSQPPLGERIEGDAQYNYYTLEQGPIASGEMFSLSFSYTKDTSNPDFPALAVRAIIPINEETAGRTPPLVSIFAWLVVFAAAMLILVGLYYIWFRTNVLQQRDRLVQGVGITNPEKQVIFCHECGMRSRLGDTYCSNCGTELRQPTAFDGSMPY